MQRDAFALDAAKKKLARYEGLADRDLISRQEWDELHVEAAKHSAQLQADEAKVASAMLDLQHCSIVAPIAGKTGRVAFHPGSLVTSMQSESLVAIAYIERLLVEFSITELQFLQVRSHNGLAMEINALSHPELFADGKVTFSDFGFDLQTGLLKMCGIIENPEMQFLPGQSVKVKLPISLAEKVLLVPDKAVKINQQGPYVYRIAKDGTAELCQVCTGEEFGKEIVIVEGLNTGDLVVTEGHLRLYPGVSVEAVMQDKDQR